MRNTESRAPRNLQIFSRRTVQGRAEGSSGPGIKAQPRRSGRSTAAGPRAGMAFPSCSHARERVRLLFLWLLVLGCCPLARAQRYPILPVAGSPPNITALLQDGQSRLWVGTVDNVWCFDGARFYSLRSFGFPAERVTSLAEDSRGGIWIGTDGDIARGGSNHGAAWIYRGDKVTQVPPGPVQSILHVSSQIHVAITARTGLR